MKEKYKVAIFGGSFDPFHIGHKRVIQGLIKLNKFDQIIVMPVGLAPHKNTYMTPAGYRYEMTRLGLQNIPEIILSDYEINRPGKYSYTLDTIEYFKKEIKYQLLLKKHLAIKKSSKKHQANRNKREEYYFQKSILEELEKADVRVKFALVYGSDALDTIESWHEPEKLMQSATLYICHRGDESKEHMLQRAAYLKDKYQAKIKFFEIDEIALSGTAIRDNLDQGTVSKAELPKNVAGFIEKNGVYTLHDDMAKLSKDNLIQLAKYENEVRQLVSRSRLIHSLNVMQYCVHLAERHNYDLMKAATAGILHDIAKQMNIKKQYQYAKKIGGLDPLNKNIAHGPAGAFYIRKYFHIADQEILDALIYHTTARKSLTTLDKILYLADKLEYGRPFQNLEIIRAAADRDLDEGMRLCLEEVRKVLTRRKRDGHPCTIEAIHYLNI